MYDNHIASGRFINKAGEKEQILNDMSWALQLIDKYKTTITQLFNAEITELKRDSLNYYIKYLYER